MLVSIPAALTPAQEYDTSTFTSLVIVRRAEVRVVGATAPERVHYGAGDAAGSIKGESAMKSLQGRFRHILHLSRIRESTNNQFLGGPDK